MKRFTLLSLLVLLCVAVGRAQTLSQLAPDEITAGKRIVLRALATDNFHNYLGGAEPTKKTIEEACIFVVEDAGDGTFLLRQEHPASVDAAYIQSPTAGGANISMSDASEAAHFRFVSHTQNPGSYENKYVASELTEKTLRVVTKLDDADIYLNCNNAASNVRFATGTGVWSIWNVYEMPAYISDYAQTLLDEAATLLDEAATLPEYLYLSTEGLDELKGALSGSESELMAAINNFNANFAITFKPGYYTLQTPGRNNKYMAYSTGNTPIVGVDGVNDLSGVWEFSRLDNGKYTVQNVFTGTYMAMPAQSQPVQLSEEPVEMTLQIGGTIEGSENLIAFGGGSGNTMAHMDGSNCLVGWNTNALATFWTLAAVDETLLTSYISTAASNLFDVRTVGCVGGPTADAAAPVVAAVEAFDEQNPTLDAFYVLRNTVEGITFEDGDIIKVVPGGLYRIQNYQRKTSTGNTACNGEGGFLEAVDVLKPAHAGATQTAFTAADQNQASADALWQLQATETEGVYRFYNPNSGSYIKCTVGQNDVAATQNEAEGGTFRISNFSYAGLSAIECVEKAEEGNRYLHISGNAGDHIAARLMFYNTSELPSAWYIRPAETLDVTLTEVGDMAWASTVLPVNVDELPEGVTAYTGELDEDADVLRLTEVEGGKVPAGLPVVLAAETAVVKQLPVSAAGAPVSVDESGALKGTLRYVDVTDDTRDSYLILGIYDDAVGFYLPAETVTAIPGNKAYLDRSTAQAVRGYALSLGGSTTGIEGVTTSDGAGSEEPVYDLSGRRVVNPTHGVYIRGGKKVYIK